MKTKRDESYRNTPFRLHGTAYERYEMANQEECRVGADQQVANSKKDRDKEIDEKVIQHGS